MNREKFFNQSNPKLKMGVEVIITITEGNFYDAKVKRIEIYQRAFSGYKYLTVATTKSKNYVESCDMYSTCGYFDSHKKV